MLCGCRPEEAPVEPGLKEPGSCAVCPGFPIEQSPKYKDDDDGVDSEHYGGSGNYNDDEDMDDSYCDGDVVVMISRPTLQPAPPAALPCSSPPLHSSSKHFRNL